MKPGDIVFLVLPIALLLLLVNSQRKRTRQAATLQQQVAPGTEVCTTSGLFGRIVSLSDAEFVLEAAPGVHLRFDRRAIGLVVPSNQPASPSGPADPTEPDSRDSPDGAGDSDGHDRPT